MKDQESSSSWRWPGFAESVAAGLVANMITAACVVIVALLGGRLKALQATSIVVLVISTCNATVPHLCLESQDG